MRAYELKSGDGINGLTRIDRASTMLEDLVRFIDTAGIRPVVDRRFAFDDAVAAYRYMQSDGHFGKVVIDIDGARRS